MQRLEHTSSRLALLAGVIALLVAASACTKKEGKKEDDGKKVDDPSPAGPSTPTGDCLRLQDEDEPEADATEADADADAEEPAEGEDAASTEDKDPDVGTDENCSSNPSSPSPSGGSGWDEGPGLDGCEADGKAWIAVKNGGPAVCGDPLVTWCCSEAEIANQFPTLAAKLAAEFDRDDASGKPAIKKGGLKLYHCSTSGDKTTFHWAKGDDGIKYVTVYATGTPKGGTKDASCPKVTMADMGFSAGEDDGDEDDDEVVEVGGDVPEAIGQLTDTSKDGMKAFLAAGTYTAWTKKDAAVRTLTNASKHAGFKNVKIFYNTALATSMTTFNASHPKDSVAVMELYDADKTTKTGYAVMGKGVAGTEADSWFFHLVKGAEEPTSHDMGVAACVACHSSSDKDHIQSDL